MRSLKRLASNFADRVAYGFGSQAALGRLNLAAATDALTGAWWRYAGRKGIRRPTVAQLLAFLEVQYGIELPPEAVRKTFGATATQTFDIDTMMPRIADVLIDAGLIDVEWG